MTHDFFENKKWPKVPKKLFLKCQKMQTFAKKCQKVQKSAKKAGFYIIGDTIRTRVCRTFFVGFGNRKIVGWSV